MSKVAKISLHISAVSPEKHQTSIIGEHNEAFSKYSK